MSLYSFVDQVGPAVPATYLNELDQIRNVTSVPVNLASFTVSVPATFSSTLGVTGNSTFTGTATFQNSITSTLAGDGALAGSININSARPQINLLETGQAANSGNWSIEAQSAVLNFAALTDAGVASNFMSVTRSGGTPSLVTIPITTTYTGTPGIIITAVAAQLDLRDTDSAADEKNWRIATVGTAGQIQFQALNDALNSSSSFMTVDRTGITIDSVTVPTRLISTQSGGGSAAGVSVRTGTPGFYLQQTGAAADNGKWDFVVSSEQLLFRVLNDAEAATVYMTVDRTGLTVDGIAFPAAGTTASAANAYLDNAASPANRLLRSTSSIRYKTDVKDIDSAEVAKLFDLRPITYRSLCDNDDKALRWYGLIAEEVADVLPRIVHYGAINRVYEDVETESVQEDGTKVKKTKQVLKSQDIVPDGVQYDRLVVLLLAKMKEQQKELEDIKAQLSELKAKKI